MSNKTTWKTGQSGNPNGRPPKSRALSDALSAAGKKKVLDSDGNEVTRQDHLADLVWQAATTGQVTFLGTNRKYNERLVAADDRTLLLKFADWAVFAMWLYSQVDGELVIQIDDTKTPDAEGEAKKEADQSAVVILPDNGRSVQRPSQETSKEQAPEEGTPTPSRRKKPTKQSG